MTFRIRLAILAAAGLVACSNAGDNLQLPALPQRVISTRVYLDRDGSRSLTTGDTTWAGIRVALFAAGGSDTLRVVATDTAGVAIFDTLPIGTYRINVDRKSLGDSIGLVAGDTGAVRIVADSAGAARLIRVGYPELTIRQARALPAGQHIFIRGVVLSPLQVFHDSSTFLSDPTGFMRVTHSRHRPGRSGNNVGDSVLVLGTSGASEQQPVLVGGLIGDLGISNLPVAVPVSITQVVDAEGGSLDAALVSLSGTVIVDTAASGSGFLLTVADPADSTKTAGVLIDSLLNIPHGVWAHGLHLSAYGVLVPLGDGTWVVKPRFVTDITLSN
jgi:hypothetical protein